MSATVSPQEQTSNPRLPTTNTINYKALYKNIGDLVIRRLSNGDIPCKPSELFELAWKTTREEERYY